MIHNDHPHPEFISHSEWQEGRRVRRVRWLRAVGGTVCVGLAVVAGACLARVASVAATKGKLSQALASIHDYRAEIKLIDAKGREVPFRTETARGEDWQVSAMNREVVFTRLGRELITCEPRFGHKVSYRASDSTDLFLQNLKTAVAACSPWRLANPNMVMSRHGAVVDFLITERDRRYRIAADARSCRPLFAVVEDKGIDGWRRDQVVSLKYGTVPLEDPLPEIAAQPPLTASDYIHAEPRAAFSTDLGVAAIRAADMNTRGDAFFLVDGLSDVSVPNDGIVREGHDRMYNVVIDQPKGREGSPTGLTLLEFRALDLYPVSWPTTLHVKLVPRGNQQVAGQFEYTFQKPTCYLMPPYQVTVGGDVPYFEYLYNASEQTGLAAPASINVTPAQSLAEIQNAIFYNRELYPWETNDDRTDELIKLWREAYSELKSSGQIGQARNAIAIAKGVLDRHPFDGGLASEVQDLAAQEGVD